MAQNPQNPGENPVSNPTTTTNPVGNTPQVAPQTAPQAEPTTSGQNIPTQVQNTTTSPAEIPVQGNVNTNANINANTDDNPNIDANYNADANGNQQQDVETQSVPQHLGGGWYLIPDGSKVQGEEKANEAYEKWKQENPDKVIIQNGEAIRVVGPYDANNRAEILRIKRTDREPIDGQDYLDVHAGQVLYIGDDISEEQANQLLESPIWKFERVSN